MRLDNEQLFRALEPLTKPGLRVEYRSQAEVAELADALRSGRSERTLMWVQVPPSAQAPQFWGAFLFCPRVWSIQWGVCWVYAVAYATAYTP
jgi:hypothetical protein